MGHSSTEVSFYQLTTHPLEKVLPKILEKVYESKMKALVLADSQERKEFLNSLLWTYSPGSFLPHGMEGGILTDAEDTPIWIALEADNRNNANVLVLTGGVSHNDLAGFARCVDIFDGNDASAVSSALERRAKYQSSGHKVIFWKQSLQGTWDRETG